MKKQNGFSLIEILVVLVIMGLLISVVAPTVLNSADDARIQKVQADFKSIETALKIYRLDNYVYPTTEQGLVALVEASTLEPEPRNFKKGGYLPDAPLDPWGREYLYLSPGECKAGPHQLCLVTFWCRDTHWSHGRICAGVEREQRQAVEYPFW